MYVVIVFIDGGLRIFWFLMVSLGFVSKIEGFFKDFKIVMILVLVYFLFFVMELRRNSKVIGNLGDGEFIELFIENEFGFIFLYW